MKALTSLVLQILACLLMPLFYVLTFLCDLTEDTIDSIYETLDQL